MVWFSFLKQESKNVFRKNGKKYNVMTSVSAWWRHQQVSDFENSWQQLTYFAKKLGE